MMLQWHSYWDRQFVSLCVTSPSSYRLLYILLPTWHFYLDVNEFHLKWPKLNWFSLCTCSCLSVLNLSEWCHIVAKFKRSSWDCLWLLTGPLESNASMTSGQSTCLLYSKPEHFSSLPPLQATLTSHLGYCTTLLIAHPVFTFAESTFAAVQCFLCKAKRQIL